MELLEFCLQAIPSQRRVKKTWLKPGTMAKAKGTGLGLAIVRSPRTK